MNERCNYNIIVIVLLLGKTTDHNIFHLQLIYAIKLLFFFLLKIYMKVRISTILLGKMLRIT